MPKWAGLAAIVCTVAVAAGTLSGCGPTDDITLETFAGRWQGHTRTLVIDRHGQAKESVGDGCCHPIVDLTFQLDDPTGTSEQATAAGRITAVAVHDAKGLSKPLPAVGDRMRLDLRDGIITESVTEQIYCGSRTGQRQGMRCGA